eukprot:TRINITY_DN66052_c0_g1_i2.p2 TRINITY_DN66052_c0_g1~~TRINITY_DN66052_c0_g1_i2.p2  ORF type:complete len:240 (-),score=53.94 TRINITY_DN66052_c0_g1_i2:517-1236(-)
MISMRNPFSRLTAYFQRAWLENPDRPASTFQDDFPVWIDAVEQLGNGGVFEGMLAPGQSMQVTIGGRELLFTLEDLYHIRPVEHVLRDVFPEELEKDFTKNLQSCSLEVCWFARQVYIVRTEVARHDLEMLNVRLCLEQRSRQAAKASGTLPEDRRDDDCRGLPQLPHLNARSPKHRQEIEDFWASPAGARAALKVARLYGADFALGAYGLDPLQQAPTIPTAEAVADFLLEARREHPP